MSKTYFFAQESNLYGFHRKLGTGKSQYGNTYQVFSKVFSIPCASLFTNGFLTKHKAQSVLKELGFTIGHILKMRRLRFNEINLFFSQ